MPRMALLPSSLPKLTNESNLNVSELKKNKHFGRVVESSYRQTKIFAFLSSPGKTVVFKINWNMRV